ncbi:RNA-binding protein 41 isoform X2 [Falco naumanni]|uniref:RNA-binding protein 41 isoform X2 n=1 Tax=Falco naumanni TaxID=148594 RepID=UPI001ADDFCA4|nr:RNA-binding protein 41 isoform X2 [Falco naumanni]XP_040470742.1 RNA-binding protein 41 isoform X2 [Falco naumanni]
MLGEGLCFVFSFLGPHPSALSVCCSPEKREGPARESHLLTNERVNSSLSSDELLLEDLETEGERQLKSLLHHQLDTTISIEQCKSKRRCFAPAAFYKPFGEEAAGALTLSQFQALQESNKETASLRELGLSDSEILLWKNRASTGKGSGLGAAPEATQDRLHAIQEKMEERQRILALPQRFAGSKQLSRREMEIENALFQGTDRHSFLRALYHEDDSQKRVTDEKDPMVHLESVYQELLSKKSSEEVQPTKSDPCLCPSLAPQEPLAEESSLADQEEQAEQAGSPSLPATRPHQSPPGFVVIKEPVEFVPEEEICKNRLSEEELRNIPRFSSYHPGEPNKVLYLKNLGPQVTMKDLVSLFARFQKEDSPPIQFRLLNGRMRGQAFITFPDTQSAQAAMLLVNGYHLQGKPVVIEFGKSKGRLPEADSAIPCSSAGETPPAKNKNGKLELDFYMNKHDIWIANFLADDGESPRRRVLHSQEVVPEFPGPEIYSLQKLFGT